MYTDPDPQFLAPTQSLEIGRVYGFFRRADLATLLSTATQYQTIPDNSTD